MTFAVQSQGRQRSVSRTVGGKFCSVSEDHLEDDRLEPGYICDLLT